MSLTSFGQVNVTMGKGQAVGSIRKGRVRCTLTLEMLEREWSGDTMTSLLAKARVASRYRFPLLITGESGTGKTSLAMAIHNEYTKNSPEAFKLLSCAAISPSSHICKLSGHKERGAPGIEYDLAECIKDAENGTLFLALDHVCRRKLWFAA